MPRRTRSSSVEGRKVVQGGEEENGCDGVPIICKKKSIMSTSDSAQVDVNPDDPVNSNLDNFDTLNPNANACTDKEVLDFLNIAIIFTVVDCHNAEVDEEEKRMSKENKRISKREYVYYKSRIKGSRSEKWCDPRKQV